MTSNPDHSRKPSLAQGLVAGVSLLLMVQLLQAASSTLRGNRFSDIALYLGLLGVALGLLVTAFSAIGWSRGRRLHAEAVDLCTRQIDKLADRPILWNVVFAALALFLEMSLIRWTAYPRLAQYRNFALLACFLGLGVGYIMGRRRLDFVPYLMPLLALHHLQIRLISELKQVAETASEVVTGPIATAAIVPEWQFVLAVLAMIAPGQLVGAMLSRQSDLRGYGANLGGSVLGILAAYLLAAIWTTPVAWMAAAGLVTLWAFPSTAMVRSTAVAMICVGLATMATPFDHLVVYSPYQRLAMKTYGFGHELGDGRMALYAGTGYYQSFPIVDTSALVADRDVQHDIPNADLAPIEGQLAGANVLALGVGAGANVTQLLRAGVNSVVAVDIDPGIVRLGMMLNADRPYLDERVRVVVDDARAYLRRSEEQFDFIIFYWIDSHPGSMSSAGFRLDSFVYTKESFEECKARLTDGGRLLVYAWMPDQARQKIVRALGEVFDSPIQTYRVLPYERQFLFAVGEGVDPKPASRYVVPHPVPDSAGAPLLSDDWPFLYLGVGDGAGRMALFLLFVIVLSAASSALATGVFDSTRSTGDWPLLAVFFLFGVAFMLVETTCIMQVALLFGNTWMVIAIVVLAILSMAFVGNLLVQKGALPRVHGLYLAALVGSLLAVGFIRANDVVAIIDNLTLARLIYVMLAASPVVFSAILFSMILEESTAVDRALGANLLGAMAGGCLEYAAMASGYQVMTLLIPVLYLLAMVIWRSQRTSATSTS